MWENDGTGLKSDCYKNEKWNANGTRIVDTGAPRKQRSPRFLRVPLGKESNVGRLALKKGVPHP